MAKQSPQIEPCPTKASCNAGLVKFYLYAIFFTIIYGLFVGFRMEDILKAGGEVPEFLKTTHVHVLLNSFLLLFLVYDLRIKCATGNIKTARRLSEYLVGVGLAGHLISTVGFSIAGLYPAMIPLGLQLSGIGLPILFLAVFAYVIAAIVAELYQ